MLDALRPEAAAALDIPLLVFNAPDEDLRDMVGESHMISLAPPIVRSSSEYQKGFAVAAVGGRMPPLPPCAAAAAAAAAAADGAAPPPPEAPPPAGVFSVGEARDNEVREDDILMLADETESNELYEMFSSCSSPGKHVSTSASNVLRNNSTFSALQVACVNGPAKRHNPPKPQV